MSIEKPPIADTNLSSYLMRALSALQSSIDSVKTFSVTAYIKNPLKGKFYLVDTANNQFSSTGLYYFNGTAFVKLTDTSSAVKLGVSHVDAYYGDLGKIAYDHSNKTGNPHGLSLLDLGLEKVDNTSDKDKPISDATQVAINGFVPTSRKVNGQTLVADIVLGTGNINETFNRYYVSYSQRLLVTYSANATTDGYLLGSDWAIFNGKQNALGFTPENVANKVIVWSSPSNVEYPSAKLVSDTFANYVPSTVLVDIKDPTGWINRDAITPTFDTSTRCLTLTGTLEYYWRGAKKTLVSPWTSTAHPNIDGSHFLLSTDGVTFTWDTTPWGGDFSNFMLGYVTKSTSPAYHFSVVELHGTIPYVLHEANHKLHGTWRDSGGLLTAGTYTEATATDAANTPGIDSTVVMDEDCKTVVAALPQGTYTTMRIGAGGLATFDTAATLPFRSSGSYVLINNPTSGAETAAVNNDYANVYVIAVPATSDTDSQKYRYLFLQPQTVFSSLVSAKAESYDALNFGNLAKAITEFVGIARITYQMAAANSNTGKCTIPVGGVSYLNTTRVSSGASSVVADVASIIHSATNKVTPVDADEFGIYDSVTGLLNKLTWANLKATLKTYFDTIYHPLFTVLPVANGGTGLSQTYHCRAWANFNGVAGVSIGASGNIASIVRFGPGVYIVTMTTAMPDTNYAVFISVGFTSVMLLAMLDATTARTTTTFRFYTINLPGVATDCAQIGVSVFR